jgi:hypothetical protein
MSKSNNLIVWLFDSLSKNPPEQVYEEMILNCSESEIDSFSQWLSRLMCEFDEALVDV